MKQIQLDLAHFNFFCPVTGHQIQSEENFDPSPASLYCYLEEEENFQFINESIIRDLKEFDLYYHGKIAYMDLENFKSFLKNKILPDVYLNFEIRHLAPASVLDHNVHHCIDMGYELPED